MSSSNGPRYAPEDPTLPKPWRGLVDGNTGYLYFWNPETNVTQYEKPVDPQTPAPGPSPNSLPKLNSVPLSSSVHVEPSVGSSDGQHSGRDSFHGQRGSSYSGQHGQHTNADESQNRHRYNDSNDRGTMNGHHTKPSAVTDSRNSQFQRGGGAHPQNGSALHSPHSSGLGGSSMHGHKPSSQPYDSNQSSRPSGGPMSTEAYRKHHEITISGNDVPLPFTSFESTGFPSEIIREARYLLQKELMSFGLQLFKPFGGPA